MYSSPTFFLYGEAPKQAEENFLHLEPLDTRSRPASWHIRPHRHEDLHHIFMLSGGAGEMRADGVGQRAVAPCLMLVPAGTEHGFAYVPETTGRVLTISDVFLRGLCAADAELASLFAIGDDGIFLDADSKRPIAHGSPKDMLAHCDHPTVQAFLRREPVKDAGTHDLVVREEP